MSKVHVMFKLINGDRFIKIFMVADNESAKDIIDTFLYRYNMVCPFMCERCDYDYEIYKVEKFFEKD